MYELITRNDRQNHLRTSLCTSWLREMIDKINYRTSLCTSWLREMIDKIIYGLHYVKAVRRKPNVVLTYRNWSKMRICPPNTLLHRYPDNFESYSSDFKTASTVVTTLNFVLFHKLVALLSAYFAPLSHPPPLTWLQHDHGCGPSFIKLCRLRKKTKFFSFST